MRAFIHGFQGRPYNVDCKIAADGFQALGVETVLFTTNEEFDRRNPEDIVVGGTVITWHALNQRGITAESYDYPEELIRYTGRKIWDTTLKDIRKETIPFFMKPVEDKLAPAVVVNTWDDLQPYELLPSETKVHCSEVVDFISEWRCFLRYGKMIGLEYYYGDQDAQCDRTVIENAVRDFPDMPAGFVLDFGVAKDGRTLLIEANDGYSLGAYGLEATLYAKLLTARWAQLNNTEDIFKDC